MKRFDRNFTPIFGQAERKYVKSVLNIGLGNVLTRTNYYK